MKLSHLLATAFLLTSTLALPAPDPNPLPEPDPRIAPGPNRFTRPKGHRPANKYFQEPGGDNELGHYDARYFRSIVSYEARRDTLYHLVRSYLTVFRARNIETWIAHGTLLGWWWNGAIMPWDWDLDTQISAATLEWLGKEMNMTMHNYTSMGMGTGEKVERQYLLDVNPNYVDRVRGDGMNVIDARWVDVRNGLFIDITGLSETNPTIQPGVWSCKNFHRYRTRDIYPLRETVFEGVPALVPYNFDRILTEEYSARALTKTMHEGHRWDAEQKKWIKQENTRFPVGHGGDAATQKSPGVAVPHTPRSLLDDGEELNKKSVVESLKRLL